MARFMKNLTVQEEVVEDAVLAAKLLLERKDVSKVYVLGHSLGGLCAPRIARAEPRIAGLVIMAGPSRPLEDLVLEQAEYQASLADEDDAEAAKKLVEGTKAQVALVKSKDLSEKTPASDLPLGIPPSYWLDLRGYEPAQVTKELKKPVLVLQGEADCQVRVADFDGWKKALEGQEGASFKLYPKLNHLFIAVEGKSTGKEYLEGGHVEAAVIEDTARFLATP
jgi:dienelactone hydrolase